ncbi:hypothetical protein V500_08399 [Pseudogymnoascus sp. VKM F-4518 (FW-2643)]|nr:hypothetical protein V500_08399 [Pseudogymnoascus sp. VKM F-4518 (FW-2643)]
MADSVDRVFVHALNTVKKIPRTGSARPPPADRLRLYGLYKQAMEGDVDGVMDRPGGGGYTKDEDTIREQEKWDAWDAQKGVSRTEAKRRYIEALIETMHRYASTTSDSRELVAELEFVWDQIKHNSASSSNSSPPRGGSGRRFTAPMSGSEGPMKVLSPMSQDDEADREHVRRLVEGEDGSDEEVQDADKAKGTPWRTKVESTLVKMTAEVAALREQIASGREWRDKKQRTIGAWLGWLLFAALKQVAFDAHPRGLTLGEQLSRRRPVPHPRQIIYDACLHDLPARKEVAATPQRRAAIAAEVRRDGAPRVASLGELLRSA